MSAEKTMEILELFDFDNRTLSVPEISTLLGQPQSSVYRHLRLLKEKGYVMETSGGNYRLGYTLLKLAKIVRMDCNISIIAYPVMKQITKITGETSILLVRSNLQAVCLETVPSNYPIKVSSEQGQIVPLYGGASSKILLAFAEDEIIDNLFEQGIVKKHTENTIIDSEQLKKNLEEIRARGYAFSDGEIDKGVISYGVPIRDMDKNVIASLSIAGPRERMLEQGEKAFLDILQSSAEDIQKYL